MEAVGTGAGVDKFSTFGHELTEQQSKQIDRKEYGPAHEDGKNAEDKIKGVTRVSENGSDLKQHSDGTSSGTYSFTYKDDKTRTTVTVTMQIDHNNVQSVTRK